MSSQERRRINEREVTERLAVVRNSLASQHIEGLEPDAGAVADAEKWARGELPISVAIARYKERLKNNC